MMEQKPKYLTCSVIIEEDLKLEQLRKNRTTAKEVSKKWCDYSGDTR